jgi:micrococcal nuclease
MVALSGPARFNAAMGRVVKFDWQRHQKRKRRALVGQLAVFVIGFAVTAGGGLAWANGIRPLQWFDQQRARPLVGRIKVIDGDTVRIEGQRIRIANIDTPEMPPRSRCTAEAILAGRATSNLEAMVNGGYEFTFIPDLWRKRDAYGRLLGRMEIDGEDVGRAQMEAGLARRWMGRRMPWC